MTLKEFCWKFTELWVFTKTENFPDRIFVAKHICISHVIKLLGSGSLLVAISMLTSQILQEACQFSSLYKFLSLLYTPSLKILFDSCLSVLYPIFDSHCQCNFSETCHYPVRNPSVGPHLLQDKIQTFITWLSRSILTYCLQFYLIYLHIPIINMVIANIYIVLTLYAKLWPRPS